MIRHDDSLERALRRHRAFWAMEEGDRPLLSVGRYELLQRRQPFRIMVDALLDLEPLRAIQVSMDYPGGPSLAELLPLFRQINAHKPLIITGPVSQSELDLLLQSLSSRGVCLQVALHSD